MSRWWTIGDCFRWRRTWLVLVSWVHVGLDFVGSNPFFTFHFRPQDDEEVDHAMIGWVLGLVLKRKLLLGNFCLALLSGTNRDQARPDQTSV